MLCLPYLLSQLGATTFPLQAPPLEDRGLRNSNSSVPGSYYLLRDFKSPRAAKRALLGSSVSMETFRFRS